MNNKRKRLFLSILLPLFVVVIWLGISAVGGPTFGKLAGVSTNSQAAFLPASAESTKVQNLEGQFFASTSIPAIVVVQQPVPLLVADVASYTKLTKTISQLSGVQTSANAVIGPAPSNDRKAVEYVVQIDQSADTKTVVQAIRTTVKAAVPSGAEIYVTGPAGLTADLVNAFGGIDGILLLVAVIAVFIILLLVYRSIILPFLVLFTAMFALTGAILFVYYLAKNNVIKLNGQSQGILSILVIGAATDYSLLLIARYRESLEQSLGKVQAMIAAFKGVLEPVAASAATVILALLCLLFSGLNSNRSLGPVAAIGITFAFLAALTFLPSVLILFGRLAFWPFEPQTTASRSNAKSFWNRVASFVGNRHRPIWITSAVLLTICSLGLFQLKASGVSTSETILSNSNAVAGETVLAKHFPAGSGSPAVIIASHGKDAALVSYLNKYPGITSAAVYPNAPVYNPQALAAPTVINGKVLINATLKDQPDSSAAEQTVTSLRNSIKQVDPLALVGGETAISVDTNETARNDLKKIIPIVLFVILLVLIVLLRSLVAPVILVLSVILSFAASLGISAFIFNHLFHFPGSDATVPLFGFIFLVALGVDYNIFLMTRVREESIMSGTRLGILRGLSVTGGVITSAGVVLAATFAALAVIPILFLAQIAFIVSFGVLLDTIVVRSLLVPSLSYEIGRHIWWPSELARKKG